MHRAIRSSSTPEPMVLPWESIILARQLCEASSKCTALGAAAQALLHPDEPCSGQGHGSVLRVNQKQSQHTGAPTAPRNTWTQSSPFPMQPPGIPQQPRGRAWSFMGCSSNEMLCTIPGDTAQHTPPIQPRNLLAKLDDFIVIFPIHLLVVFIIEPHTISTPTTAKAQS